MKRGQSRRASLAESFINVGIGYGIALASQAVIYPMFGIHLSLGTNALIAGIFTVISIVRSYALRRLFNSFTVKA